MIKNFQEIISQIKSQVPIQDLISEFITVKKSGRGYVAVCPFHDDHHPSLQIHPQKGIFKCFACGTGGDIISFYAQINKKKWSESVPELALKYGLKVEYGNENKTEVELKKQLYGLNRESLNFFKANLFKSTGENALNYLTEQRKLLKETIEKYEAGYALNSWDSLYNFLSREKGYSQELIIASGLFIPRESQDSYYDRFRNRVIFPIFDENNNVIGFGGRALANEEVKYINSPETLVFSKGQNLYGLNFAKDEIKRLDHVILTEGYLDVITAHQSGLLNTVATLGTALTVQQVRLLAKYTDSKKICLCMDTDTAGKKAVESIFRLTQDISSFISLDLRVTTDLKGKDLDESLKTEDAESIKNKVANGQKLIHFIFDRITNSYHSSNESEKKKILDELIETIIAIRDAIEQSESIKYISHKLNIDEELITIKIKDKARLLKQKKLKFDKPVDTDENDSFKMHSTERFKHAELELLSLYISSFPQKTDELKLELNNFEFLDEKHKLIKDFIDNLNTKEISPGEIINQLILEFNEYKQIMSTIADLAWRIETEEQVTNYSKNKGKILTEAKESINWWVTNKKKMKDLSTSLKECGDKGDKEKEKEILLKMFNLIQKKEAST